MGSSYFGISGILTFLLKFRDFISQRVKKAISNRTNYIHLHTLHVEDDMFVQMYGKSLSAMLTSLRRQFVCIFLSVQFQSLVSSDIFHISIQFRWSLQYFVLNSQGYFSENDFDKFWCVCARLQLSSWTFPSSIVLVFVSDLFRFQRL